jgi:hypothetical protein
MSNLSESDIIFPDKTLNIGDEEITVHEFKYLEGLSAAAIAQPLLADLLSLIQDADTMGLPELDRIIGKNADVWTQLLAMSARKPAEWVAELNDTDGTLLSMTFWEINGPFLLRRVAFAKRFGTIVLNQPPVAS